MMSQDRLKTRNYSTYSQAKSVGRRIFDEAKIGITGRELDEDMTGVIGATIVDDQDLACSFQFGQQGWHNDLQILASLRAGITIENLNARRDPVTSSSNAPG